MNACMNQTRKSVAGKADFLSALLNPDACPSFRSWFTDVNTAQAEVEL